MMKRMEDIQVLVANSDEGYDWRQHGHIAASYSEGMTLLNYTNAAMWEGNWPWLERVCRGLIIGSNGEIVARPFDKFFNWLERGMEEHTTNAPIQRVYEKIDGSLGILYRSKGRYAIATRGSFGSDQAKWATEYYRTHFGHLEIPQEWTLLFEIVYPDNRVVVDYGNYEGLMFLDARDRFSGEYIADAGEIADFCHFDMPQVCHFDSIDQLVKARESLPLSKEGWVVVFEDGQRFKFKGDEYLRLHRLIHGISLKKLYEVTTAGLYDQYRESIPEEFAGQLDDWYDDLMAEVRFGEVEITGRYAGADKSSRKAYALSVKDSPYSGCLFRLFDKKGYLDVLLKLAYEKVKSREADDYAEGS